TGLPRFSIGGLVSVSSMGWYLGVDAMRLKSTSSLSLDGSGVPGGEVVVTGLPDGDAPPCGVDASAVVGAASLPGFGPDCGLAGLPEFASGSLSLRRWTGRSPSLSAVDARASCMETSTGSDARSLS